MAGSTSMKKEEKLDNGGKRFRSVGRPKTNLRSKPPKTVAAHSDDRVQEEWKRNTDRYRRNSKKD